MTHAVIDKKLNEFYFLAYDDDDGVFISDNKTPQEHGIEIPFLGLVDFRDKLNEIIKEVENRNSELLESR